MSETLFADFAPSTRDEWIDAVRASLRGAALESLTKRSYEGIEINPLPHADDLAGINHHHSLPGQFPFVRGTRAGGYRVRPWLIAAELDISDPRQFNMALRDGLANGLTAITISDQQALPEAEDIRLALAAVDLQRYPLIINSDARAPEIFALLAEELDADALGNLRGCFGADPLSQLAKTGVMPADAFDRLAAHVATVAERAPQLSSIAVDTAVYHDAGADAVQELALAIATGVAYLRLLNERGLAVDEVAGKLRFSFNIGENFFLEVAKFRAIRLLWAQVLRAFSLEHAMLRLRVHARSGRRNKARLDAHVNLLRLTTEALSAAIGGVDCISLSPFDQPLGASNDFSRRLSRNLQLILQNELRLVELIDPAGGSWHVERLTDQVARAAWSRFQQIEADGGIIAALRSGAVQADIEAIARQRQRDIASGESVLVGVNRYIDPAATGAAQPKTSAAAAETVSAAATTRRLRPIRLAEPFEARHEHSGDS